MLSTKLISLCLLLLVQQDPKAPSVFLNHFYVVIDSSTYGDIKRGQFLRSEFAVTEERTTVRSDRSYTGFYVYGTNTYFEFFNSNNKGVAGQFSRCGIAFGVDQKGDLKAIEGQHPSQILASDSPVTRVFSGSQVPWFYQAWIKGFLFASDLAVWIMEYHPRFLAEWNPHGYNGNQGISRNQILRRYASILREIPEKPILGDVVGLTIALERSTLKKFADACRLFGYEQKALNHTIILKGPEIEFRLIPEMADARGLQDITMRVNRKPEGQNEFRFGVRSVLRLHDNGLATWFF